MATPETLVKYASINTAMEIINSGTLRWSSPELFNEPWAVRFNPELSFDHHTVSKAMLRAATAMIFTRDLPAGNLDHPLYKAIRRWRGEDRFHDENEAYEALSELLAPTPETLRGKLEKMICQWQALVETARVICFSENHRELRCWEKYADNYRGVALRFARRNAFANPEPVDYTTTRPNLTTVKEQVDDLVGIRAAEKPASFTSRFLMKPRSDAQEKEWRCIRIMNEEDLDCGEDIEDWYMDEPFHPQDLEAVYLGFRMSEYDRETFSQLIRSAYPSVTIYQSRPQEDQYELDFQKIS
ncbi:MAG: hypothetical protein KDI36_04775 [Pseudomonadales bacterium]|nr:hypothetical protein [Pseudomonadales bacterium]